MKTTVLLGTVALGTVFYGCELQQQLVNEMQADTNDFDQALCWGMRLLQSMTTSPSFGVFVNGWTMAAWALCYLLYGAAGAGDSAPRHHKSRPINPLSSQTKDSGRSCITLSQQRHESCGITRPSGGA